MEVCKTTVYFSVVPPSEVSCNVFLSCEMWSRRHCAGRRDRPAERTGVQYSRRDSSCLPQLRLRLLSAQWPGCGCQTPDGWVHVQEEDSHRGFGCTSGTWLPTFYSLVLFLRKKYFIIMDESFTSETEKYIFVLTKMLLLSWIMYN